MKIIIFNKNLTVTFLFVLFINFDVNSYFLLKKVLHFMSKLKLNEKID